MSRIKIDTLHSSLYSALKISYFYANFQNDQFLYIFNPEPRRQLSDALYRTDASLCEYMYFIIRRIRND